MKAYHIIQLLLLLCAVSLNVEAQEIDHDKITFTVTLDRDNPDYKPGEPMKFTFKVDFGEQAPPEKNYSVLWVRSGDDGIRKSGEFTVVPGKAEEVVVSTDKPGFVRLEAWLQDSEGKNIPVTFRKGNHAVKRQKAFDGGAGVEIFSLKQAVAEPADFDAFWTRQKARLNKVPLKYTLNEVAMPDKDFKQYAVTIDCAGPRPVTGYLVIPAKAKDKSLDAIVSYHGYGTGAQKPFVKAWRNAIYFSVNAHGYELGKDQQYYKDFAASIRSGKHNYAFDPAQNADPEKAYFNGMAMRVMRSLQFVKSLPAWNGMNLKVEGGSQGGMQSIWGASLDSQVNEARVNDPWCADVGGVTVKRLNGWQPSYVPGLNYYDIINHAKRIGKHCKVTIVKSGLGDYVCPPSGVTSLYNSIIAPKEIVYYQGSDHGFSLPGGQTFKVKAK